MAAGQGGPTQGQACTRRPGPGQRPETTVLLGPLGLRRELARQQVSLAEIPQEVTGNSLRGGRAPGFVSRPRPPPQHENQASESDEGCSNVNTDA